MWRRLNALGDRLEAIRCAGAAWPSRALQAAPGLGLCLAVGGSAQVLGQLERGLGPHTGIEPLALAILVGLLIRTVWAPPPLWRVGVAFCGRFLMELAVALLGLNVTLGQLDHVARALTTSVVAAVVTMILAGFGLGRLAGLSPALAMLAACGNAICGNSAIAAVGPAIGAKTEEVAAAIAFTAVLGVLVVLALPLVGQALGLSATQFGVFAGMTVYAVPQVVAATAGAGPVAAQTGAIVKLIRVLMLGPVVLVLALLRGRRDAAARPSLAVLAPWFIVAFVLLAAVRAGGLAPVGWLPPLAAITGGLMIVAMAALGLSTDLGALIRAGPRLALVVAVSMLALALLSLGTIRALGL